jgi:hypothetical protein
MKRWSIYIDVEGFSKIYETNQADALLILGELAKPRTGWHRLLHVF